MFPQTYDVYQILSGLQRALPQSTLSETSEKDYLSGEAKNAVLMEENTNKPVVRQTTCSINPTQVSLVG